MSRKSRFEYIGEKRRAYAKSGKAKPGHPGHGRRSVEPDKADRVRELPRPDECPDCGGRLLDFGTSSRTLRDCALYRFRGTRSSSVAVEVFRGSAGTTTTDRYPGYDNTVPGKHTWCFEHIRRNFLELLKSEPDNREYNKFIPALVDLLKQAMKLRGRRLPLAKHIREGDRIKKEILRIAATRVKDGALQAKCDIFLEHPNKLWHWIKKPNIPAENNWAERCIRNTVIFRKTGFGSQGEAAMADRETLQSVMETLSLRHKDPVGVLAEARKAYKPRFRRGMTAEERQMAKEAAAEKVADVLFPRDGRTKPKRE